MSFSPREMIDVIVVPRADVQTVAGMPWEEAANGREIRNVQYWSRDNIPQDHAFLRKIDGRAFLYLQNY
jgi:hypothetical protein